LRRRTLVSSVDRCVLPHTSLAHCQESVGAPVSRCSCARAKRRHRPARSTMLLPRRQPPPGRRPRRRRTPPHLRRRKRVSSPGRSKRST
jgi:hypothetical protein